MPSETPDLSSSADPSGGETTTLHFRRAADGAAESLGWLVERFDPFLYAAARHRLKGAVRRACDPEDLVSEVWAVALRRLRADGPPLDTPTFLAFLSTTLRNILNNVLRKHLRRRQSDAPPAEVEGTATAAGFDRMPADITSVTTRMRVSELRTRLWAALEELDAADRDVVILRGIEQIPNREVAMLLNLAPGTLSVRFHRAIEKLRLRLPASIFGELAEV